MKCPACATNLKRKRVNKQNVDLDQCPGCHGIWFDAGELRTVLAKLGTGLKTLPKDAARRDNRDCPRCDMPLFEYLYPDTNVPVDTCKSCGGTWLDNEELAAIKAARKQQLANSDTIVQDTFLDLAESAREAENKSEGGLFARFLTTLGVRK